MTKEQLQQRLKELDGQLEQALSTVNAIHGAKQEANYWLAKLEEVKHDD
jgi:hypothetical protein